MLDSIHRDRKHQLQLNVKRMRYLQTTCCVLNCIYSVSARGKFCDQIKPKNCDLTWFNLFLNHFLTFAMTSISGGKALGQALSHSCALSNRFSFPSQPVYTKGLQPLALLSKYHFASVMLHCALPIFLGREHLLLAVISSEWCLQELSQDSKVLNRLELPLQLKYFTVFIQKLFWFGMYSVVWTTYLWIMLKYNYLPFWYAKIVFYSGTTHPKTSSYT